MPLRPVFIIALTLAAGCSEQTPEPAPQRIADAGVCFKVQGEATIVVERNVPNIETCAARLEVLRQQTDAPVEGRYQTVRLYVDAASIQAAREDGAGPRFRVFQPAALTALQEATRRRLAAEAAPRRTGPPVAEGLPPAPRAP